jgi:uncharacterized protein (TIGR02145 family)
VAENLNYDAKGSKCYDNNPENCDKYGRLYDWATAMALSSACNSNSCASQVGAKHRGICPSGWHIPSEADWEKLLRHVDADTEVSDFYYRSPIAGKYLKTTSGWNDYNENSSNGTDSLGFSALPGGCIGSSGLFGALGNEGFWWSASESHKSGVYSWNISYSGEVVVGTIFGKSQFFSVRCVKD